MKYYSLTLRGIFFIAVCMLTSSDLISMNNKDDVFNHLSEKFAKLESISFEFKDNSSNIKGFLKAKKGGKFRMLFGDQLIVTNGSTIWNHQIEEEKVMISNRETLNYDYGIETFFFEFTNNYIPTKFTKYNSSTSTGEYKLETKLNSESELIDIEEMEFILDKDYNIISVIFNNGFLEANWDIINLQFNPYFKDSEFEFELPENIEVIDMLGSDE